MTLDATAPGRPDQSPSDLRHGVDLLARQFGLPVCTSSQLLVVIGRSRPLFRLLQPADAGAITLGDFVTAAALAEGAADWAIWRPPDLAGGPIARPLAARAGRHPGRRWTSRDRLFSR